MKFTTYIKNWKIMVQYIYLLSILIDEKRELDGYNIPLFRMKF